MIFRILIFTFLIVVRISLAEDKPLPILSEEDKRKIAIAYIDAREAQIQKDKASAASDKASADYVALVASVCGAGNDITRVPGNDFKCVAKPKPNDGKVGEGEKSK